MKNILKILLGMFVCIIYIPFSISISYAVMSGITNIFNKNYQNVLLNIIFGIVTLIVLFLFIYLLKIIINKSKIIKKHIKFITVCCFVPIIIFCISAVALNLNFFNIQKEVSLINTSLLGETDLLHIALSSISAIFFIFAFLYLIVFIMYVIVEKCFVKMKSSENK